MSDEKEPKYIDLNWSHISYARIKPIAVDPAIKKQIQVALDKAAEKAIYESMGIPTEIITEGKISAWKDSLEFERTFTVQIQSTREDMLEKLRRLFETPYDKFCREWINTMQEHQVHDSLIEKHRYVLTQCRKQVIDLLETLTIKQFQDVDWFSQQLVTLYNEATK